LFYWTQGTSPIFTKKATRSVVPVWEISPLISGERIETASCEVILVEVTPESRGVLTQWRMVP
jgi:hypothetical protein